MKNIILYKSREVKHCPPHFIKVPIALMSDFQNLDMLTNSWGNNDNVRARIRNWLHENCENRFYIGIDLTHSSGISVESFIVSFENPADATYFTLLMSSFTKNK